MWSRGHLWGKEEAQRAEDGAPDQEAGDEAAAGLPFSPTSGTRMVSHDQNLIAASTGRSRLLRASPRLCDSKMSET